MCYCFFLQSVDLDFYIDIHAHSTLTNGRMSFRWFFSILFLDNNIIIGFMYGNIYDEEERFERQAVFPKLLAKHAEDFSWVIIII